MSLHPLCACLVLGPCSYSSLLCREKELGWRKAARGACVREPSSKHFPEDYVFRLPPYIPPFTLHVYACLSNDSAWGQCLKPAPFSSLYVIHFDVGLQKQESERGGERKMFKEKHTLLVCAAREEFIMFRVATLFCTLNSCTFSRLMSSSFSVPQHLFLIYGAKIVSMNPNRMQMNRASVPPVNPPYTSKVSLHVLDIEHGAFSLSLPLSLSLSPSLSLALSLAPSLAPSLGLEAAFSPFNPFRSAKVTWQLLFWRLTNESSEGRRGRERRRNGENERGGGRERGMEKGVWQGIKKGWNVRPRNMAPV